MGAGPFGSPGLQFTLNAAGEKTSGDVKFCMWKCLVDERGQRRMARSV